MAVNEQVIKRLADALSDAKIEGVHAERAFRSMESQIVSLATKTKASTKEMDDLEKSLVKIGKASKNVGNLAKAFGAFSALVGAAKAPIAAADAMERGFSRTKKAILEFENSLFLSVKSLQQSTVGYKTAGQALNAYNRSVSEIQRFSKLSREESMKLFDQVQKGYKGLKDDAVVRQLSRMTAGFAELGLNVEEAGKRMQTVLELRNQFAEFTPDALVSGAATGRLTSMMAMGIISPDQMRKIGEEVRPLSQTKAYGGQGVEGAGIRGRAEMVKGNQALQDNRRLEQELAIARSDVFEKTLMVEAATARLAGAYAQAAPGAVVLAESLNELTAIMGGAALIGGISKLGGAIMSRAGGAAASGAGGALASAAGGAVAKGAGKGALGRIAGSGIARGAGRLAIGGLSMMGPIGLAAAGIGLGAYGLYRWNKNRKAAAAAEGGGAGGPNAEIVGKQLSEHMKAVKEAMNPSAVLERIGEERLSNEAKIAAAYEEQLAAVRSSVMMGEKLVTTYGSLASAATNITKDAALAEQAYYAQAHSLQEVNKQHRAELNFIRDQMKMHADNAANAKTQEERMIAQNNIRHLAISEEQKLAEIRAGEMGVLDYQIKGMTAQQERRIELQNTIVSAVEAERDLNTELRMGIGVNIQDQIRVAGVIRQQAEEQKGLVKLYKEAAAAAEDQATKVMFTQKAQEAQTSATQLETKAVKELRAIREGYLEMFEESMVGAGEFAMLMPTQTSGVERMAGTPGLGTMATSASQLAELQKTRGNAPAKMTAFGFTGIGNQFGQQSYLAGIEGGRFKDMVSQGFNPAAMRVGAEGMDQLTEVFQSGNQKQVDLLGGIFESSQITARALTSGRSSRQILTSARVPRASLNLAAGASMGFANRGGVSGGRMIAAPRAGRGKVVNQALPGSEQGLGMMEEIMAMSFIKGLEENRIMGESRRLQERTNARVSAIQGQGSGFLDPTKEFLSSAPGAMTGMMRRAIHSGGEKIFSPIFETLHGRGLVSAAKAPFGGGGSKPVNINVYVDGERIMTKKEAISLSDLASRESRLSSNTIQ